MRRTTTLMTCAVFATVLLTGCEEAVNPILGTDRPFTLYGYLDPSADRQAIRVYPIEGLLVVGDPMRLDATVVSREVTTGVEQSWRDSVVTFDVPAGNGQRDPTWGNVFWTTFRPSYGAEYDLRVARSDGAESRVRVRTPERAVVTVGDPDGIRSNIVLPVHYGGAARTLETVVYYTVGTAGTDETWRIGVTYEGLRRATGNGIDVVVQLSGDLGTVYRETGIRPGREDIYLLDVEIRTFVASDDWDPPTEDFDPELLVEPGTFSNVENGFGFVGAGYFDQTRWDVDPVVAELAGYDIKPEE